MKRHLSVIILLGLIATGAWAQSTKPAALTITKAVWQVGKQPPKDVTRQIADKVVKDRLEMTVSAGDYGDAKKGSSGTLSITYVLDGIESTEKFRNRQDVWIAKVSKEQAEVLDKAEEMRKEKPDGLLIVDARYGAGNQWRDVRRDLIPLIHEESLTIPVGNDAFGDPAGGHAGKVLKISYHDGRELISKEVPQGTTLQIGKTKVPVLARGGKLIPLRERYAQLSDKYNSKLVVLDARFGTGNRWVDVTELCQSCVTGDSMTIPISRKAFGDPSPGASPEFQITYSPDGKEFISNTVPGPTMQVGKLMTAICPMEGGVMNCAERAAELRKKHPTGLLILHANWGASIGFTDVTEKLQEAVKGNSLTHEVSEKVFGDPQPGAGYKMLRLTYWDGRQGVTQEIPPGGKIKITYNPQLETKPGKPAADAKKPPANDPATKTPPAEPRDPAGAKPKLGAGTIKSPAGGVVDVAERLAELRPTVGDGLIILDAQYGSGNRWADVRSQLQESVSDHVMSVKVGDGWGDPAPGAVKELIVAYWNGREVKSNRQAEGSVLTLKGEAPEALKGLAAFPRYVAVGQKMSHPIGAKGEIKIEEGPDGARVSGRAIEWSPGDVQVGAHKLAISLTEGGRTHYYVTHVEVVSRSVAAAAGGAGKLDAVMRLDIGPDASDYFPGLDYKSAMVLTKTELIVVNGDGTTVKSRQKIDKPYTRIAERNGYYVALCSEPKSVDLLNKTTLKPIRSIRLPFNKVTDLVLHPLEPLAYVAVEQPSRDEASYRVVVIDETAGTARQHENLVGTFVQVDPAGRWLYTGYRDVYRAGTRYFMNPDGRLWDTPEFGNIDLLLVYDLSEPAAPRLREYKSSVGANGSGLRLSPDGKRLSYLSFTGFPEQSKSIPAWDVADLKQVPVAYACKDRANNQKIAYHPTLPLAIVPADEGAVLFDRETGDEAKDRVELPPGVLQGARVVDAYFSPDGLSALLRCQRGEAVWLYKLPLKLNAEETGTAKRGFIPPQPPQKPRPGGSKTKGPEA